jgi:hypothetical protein
MKSAKSISLSITEGRVIRDLFENGFLEMMCERGVTVTCLTPAARFPKFVSQWSRPGIRFFPLRPFELDTLGYRALRVRKFLSQRGQRLLKGWQKLEPRFFQVDQECVDAMCGSGLAVFTHPMAHAEMPIFRAAAKLGIPTLGVLRSWDNLYKGLQIMPQTLAVWNEINREEAVRLIGYQPEQVKVVGGAQFDQYFAPDANWTREQFASHYQLDVSRPIIVLATLGAFLHLYDETYLVDWLLKEIEHGNIPSRPQVVIRLHPASKLEHFQNYLSNPDVQISSIKGYIPSLGWTMERCEVVEVANLLRHADLVISPGSTITIEAAIFDTPTIVPLFHTYQPELGAKQYDFHLRNHFKRLRELDLVPFVNTPEDLLRSINYALGDRSWYRKQRAQLVSDYIHFTDGQSTKRLVDLIEEVCHAPATIA